MEPLEVTALPEQALLLVDTAPIVYVLEGRAVLAKRFEPLFAAHARGSVHLAVTTVSIAEVLTGPLRARDESLARRYRAVLESWHVVALDVAIAETAARMRARFGLKLADAVQAASAAAINSYALVTHDRDFSRVTSLRVLT
jgi:predicted nucleic acid-binding protein